MRIKFAGMALVLSMLGILAGCGGGGGGGSATASGGGGATTPTAPTGVAAAASSATQININWTNVSDATAYNFYRSTASNVQIIAGNKITIASPPTSGPYSDTGLAASTTYYYKVTAVNTAGESVGSSEVSATTSAAASTTPTVTGFSPTSGAVNATVTITGTNLGNFTPAAVVKFGTTTATVTSANTTTIVVTVPASLAAGNSTITLSNFDGTGVVTVGTFNVTAAGGGASGPTVTGFSPTSGAVNATVTITGTNLGNFTPAAVVKFGTTTATVTSANTTTIVVTVPASLATGNSTITLSNGDGTGSVTVGVFNVTAGSGGGGSSNVTGTFVDATVVGMAYKCGSSTTVSGTTDANGKYTCPAGQAVAFYVGDILIGSVSSIQAVVTPLDLVGAGASPTNTTVTNIVRFLMSISSTDPAIGIITIAPAVSTAATGQSVDFINTPAGSLDTLITTLKPGATVYSSAQATTHIASSINGLFAGNYSGSFSGTWSGTWSVTIDTNGTISTGSFTGTGGNGPVTGSMSTTLSTGSTYGFTGTAGDTDWTGTLNVSTGKFSGTWSGGPSSGTFTN